MCDKRKGTLYLENALIELDAQLVREVSLLLTYWMRY